MRGIVGLGIGLVIGGAFGALGSKLYFDRKYKALADEEIADYKYKKNKEITEQVSKLVKAEGELKEKVISELIAKYTAPKKSISDSGNKPRSEGKFVDYGTYYRKKDDILLPVDERIFDEFNDVDPGAPPEGDESDSDVDEMDTLNFDRAESYKRGIEIINEDEWQAVNSYEKKEYFYYLESETVTDENDEILDGFIDILGNSWLNDATDGKDVYVRNNYTGVDYLINVIDGSYYVDE